MRPQGKKKPWFKKSSPTIETLSSSSEDEEVGLRDRKFIRKKRSPDMQALLDRVEPRSRPDVGVSSSVEQVRPFLDKNIDRTSNALLNCVRRHKKITFFYPYWLVQNVDMPEKKWLSLMPFPAFLLALFNCMKMCQGEKMSGGYY